MRFKTSMISTSVILALSCGPVLAMSDSDNYQEKDDVEVIYVYAQKRPQNIKDVAVATTSISGDLVESLEIKDTTQLAQMVPNVKTTNNAGEGTPPAFSIRGVGMIDYNTSTVSPIAIYNDGIVSGSANNLSVNLYDMEYLEVLRGPQGTLFGRNTTGGAVLLRSKMPVPGDENTGFISGTMAQHAHTNVTGAFATSLTDDTAIRLSFNRQDYDFSTHNLNLGSPNGGLEQTSLRAIVVSQWDSVTVTGKFHKEDWSGYPKPIGSLGIMADLTPGDQQQCSPQMVGSMACTDNFGFQIGSDDYWDVNADTYDRKHDSESDGISVRVDWEVNSRLNLSSLTGMRNLTRYHSWDSDGPGNFIEGDMGTDVDFFSQELTAYLDHGAYYWIAGLFFMEEDIKQDNSIDLFRDFRQVPGLEAIPAQFIYDNKLENSSFAAYVQMDHEIAEDTVLTAGLRYTDESTDYTAKADLDIVPMYIPALWDIKGSVEDGEMSGKIAINHKLDDDIYVYASYSRGYKSGGYNAGYTTSPEQASDSEYRPETLDAIEFGGRLSFMDNNANLNMSAFFYNYNDQQVFINRTTGTAPYHVLKNAGDSKIYGLEAELSMRPVDSTFVKVNVGWLPKADMGSFEEGGVTVADNRLPFASKWNISGIMEHEVEFMDGQLVTQFGFDYQSSFFFDQNENPYTEQGAYTLWNASVSYELAPGLQLSVFGKNLTNTKYSELRFDSIAALGAVTELKGEARQIGVGMKYEF